MKRFLAALVAVLALGACVFAHGEPTVDTLTLLGCSHASSDVFSLSEADTQWLQNKESLILGTSRESSPPFELVSIKNDYEGLTADYAELLADLLQIKVEVRRYQSKSEEIAALRAIVKSGV